MMNGPLKKPPPNCPNEEACVQMLEMDRRHWHLDRSISVGHIVTTISIIGAGIWWAMRQNDRLTTLEQHMIVMTQSDIRQDQERKELRQEIRDELREIKAMIESMRRGR